ncbi:serine hydrolase domain-containing protein [Peribacillus muralis]|uniref:serine hydrolase domain-containing protein n=1 Tax=Peribacillus muralis TaxID=264697 RepID=UPI003CFEBBE0
MYLNSINIYDRMEHYNVLGLSIAVIEDGQISNTECFGVLEAGTNKNVNSRSVFNACSISKFLTSILVMKLTEQGALDLDDDVNNRLCSWKVPDNELTKKHKVTLRNILSHQSGIIDPEGSFSELNSVRGFPTLLELLEGRTPYCRAPIEVKYVPGCDFQYSDAGFVIIQLLIEDVTGKPFKELVNELIFQPLMMNNSTLEMAISKEKREDFSCGHNVKGEVVDGKYPIYPYPAASALWTTPSDLAILVIELMNSLKEEGTIGISASTAKTIINSQGCKEWTGLGVFLGGSEQEIEISSLGWGVGFQCMMVAYPYLGTGIVIMTNTDLGVHQMKGIIGEIYKLSI